MQTSLWRPATLKDMVRGHSRGRERHWEITRGFALTESALKSKSERKRTIYVSMDSKKGAILTPEK